MAQSARRLEGLATRDLHLLSGTASVNAGQNAPTYMNASGSWVDGTPAYEPGKTVTQIGRLVDATLDCGAYEYHSPVPSVAFNGTTSSGSETSTTVSLPVSLSQAFAGTVTVQYAVTGGGTDYTLASGTLTFTPGVTVQNIPVTVVNDVLDENDETIVVTLSSPTNATLGANTTHTYTIIDDDAAPTVQFNLASSQGSEAVSAVNLAVSLSAASGKTVTVNYAATGGTAVAGYDYTLAGTSLTFNPGETGKVVPITILEDGWYQPTDTIIVTLSSPTNATLGTNTVHTYTITEDEAQPTVQFSATSSGGAESVASVNLQVTLSEPSDLTTTVQYAVTGGTATSPADYSISGSSLTFSPGETSKTIPITVVDDALNEVDETILVTLSNPTNASLGTNTAYAYTIQDNDAAPTVQFTQTSSSGSESVTSVNLAVSLSAASGKTVTVNYAATGGTATSPADYTISGTSLTFSPGVTSQNMSITVVDDTAIESNETIVVSLSGPSNATLGANTVHTYTINDNDAVTPTVQFSAATSNGSEATTSVTIPVTLSVSSSQTVTVQYAVTGGTATGSGTDYTLAAGTLTFNPTVTSQNIPVTVVNDALDEVDETIIVTLSSPTNATLGTTTTHTYTINDDDATPTVAFSAASSSGSEATTSVNLAVILSAASGQTVTVNYAATGGTATGGGTDYTLTAGTLTFAPGVTSQNVPITVVNDTAAESNETIIVTLSGPTNTTLKANTTHTYTINDNDTAPTLVAAGTVASGTGAITPALPSGLQANDILLLFVETANQAISITNQNGGTWTQVTGSPQGTGTAGGTAATSLTVFWSRYNGTQGAPTTSDSGDHQLGRIIAIRGATTSGNPWDVTAGGVEATSDTSGSIAGATTTVANTLVVVAIATSLPDASGTSQFSGWTNANLSSLTERTDNTVTDGNGGGLAIATGGKATAGAYGATAVTLANAAQKGMMSIAIKP